MLRLLAIRDFALIDEITLEFQGGLTVLAGETGAGKSIIIDALAIALGGKTTPDIVRSGARKAVVEATFVGTVNSEIAAIIKRADLEWDAPETLIRREISAAGTSRFFVNDTPAPVGIVRELASFLLDFHGQHDTHGLLNEKRHITILDENGDYGQLLESMKGAWVSLCDARKKREHLEDMAAQSGEIRSDCERTIRQVAELNPLPDEDADLNTRLQHAESREVILQAATRAREALSESDASAMQQLIVAKACLEQLLPFDATLASIILELESAITSCKEATAATSALADTDSLDSAALESMRLRLAALQRLIRQYGSLGNALNEADKARTTLEELQQIEALLSDAMNAEQLNLTQAHHVASMLTTARIQTGASLAEKVTTSLRTMGMPKASAAIRITPSALSANGADHVTFLLSANAGEDLRPLHMVASGGELSRFMVALKSAIVHEESVGTLVFDEIDNGISGRVARRVGEVIAGLSANVQVICISHLAQIASLAAHIIRVTKTELEGRTNISAVAVIDSEATLEIARLLSGDQVTETALQGARELMERNNAT